MPLLKTLLQNLSLSSANHAGLELRGLVARRVLNQDRCHVEDLVVDGR